MTRSVAPPDGPSSTLIPASMHFAIIFCRIAQTVAPPSYRHTIGNLVTARRIIDSVQDGTIDIGPLDAYWHMLIRKYHPEMTDGVRVLQSTRTAPMPAFVASPGLDVQVVDRMRRAFAEAHLQSWFEPIKNALLIEGFSPVTSETFQETLEWDREARAANYVVPA